MRMGHLTWRPNTWSRRWAGKTTSDSSAHPGTGPIRTSSGSVLFTVTYPRPSQVVLTSLAAAPRDDDDTKPALALLPTRPARTIDGVFLEDGYLFLECSLERIIDDFGENSLIAGRVVAAQVAEDALRLSEREDADVLLAAPLMAYLAPGRYAEIRSAQAFPYPVGFTSLNRRTGCVAGSDHQDGSYS